MRRTPVQQLNSFASSTVSGAGHAVRWSLVPGRTRRSPSRIELQRNLPSAAPNISRRDRRSRGFELADRLRVDKGEWERSPIREIRPPTRATGLEGAAAFAVTVGTLIVQQGPAETEGPVPRPSTRPRVAAVRHHHPDDRSRRALGPLRNPMTFARPEAKGLSRTATAPA